jgi:AcrR family transcriptional regulator
MTRLKGPPCGLRERKKQRTREALARAAIALFVEKGYDATTVDEIAAAVDVSQRTFFRYFAGKEEAALAVEDSVEAHFLDALAARPPEEPPFEALRNALADAWDGINADVIELVPPSVHMRMHRLIESTPQLLAAQMRRSAVMEERVTAEIARREGVDPVSDPRPRIVVAALNSVMRSASRVWSTGDDLSVESMRRLCQDHFDLLIPALTTSWRESTRSAEEKITSNVT